MIAEKNTAVIEAAKTFLQCLSHSVFNAQIAQEVSFPGGGG